MADQDKNQVLDFQEIKDFFNRLPIYFKKFDVQEFEHPPPPTGRGNCLRLLLHKNMVYRNKR